ncbi:MAG: peptidyl-prolyl cis-trans isomerase cyclophilin type, partial [Phenylobacterium sp.]|nr:peptidyl-prolyl cis-trans isomerase cyclophilin type [Phenylobacterium sp.]
MRTVAVLLAASLLAAAQAHAEGPATDAATAATPVHRKAVAKPAASTVKAAASPATTPAPKPIAPPTPVAAAPLPPVGAGGAVSAPVTVTAQRQPLTDWRPLDAENALVIDTGKGRIVVELRPEVAPLAVARVKRLARSLFYDGLLFLRVVEGFVAQTGNPDNLDGGKSLEPNLPAEFTFRLGAEVPRTIAARPQGESEGFIGAQPYVSVDEQRMAMSPDRRVSAWGAYCAGVMGMGHDADPDSGNSELFFMRETTRS